MTTTELLLQTFNIELTMTRPFLERVPEDLIAWQPHPKSMTMGRLAMHVAGLPAIATLCLSTDTFNFNPGQGPDTTYTTRDVLLGTFDTNANHLRGALTRATDTALFQPWRVTMGDRTLSETPRGVVLLHNCLGHLSHHRAQLGMYLRLNNLPVPSVYGPTADQLTPT